MLLPPLVKLEEKAFQKTNPEKTKMVGEIPPDEEPSFFDANVRMATIKAGCNKTHNTPKTVCLYFTLTSRQVKK